MYGIYQAALWIDVQILFNVNAPVLTSIDYAIIPILLLKAKEGNTPCWH